MVSKPPTAHQAREAAVAGFLVAVREQLHGMCNGVMPIPSADDAAAKLGRAFSQAFDQFAPQPTVDPVARRKEDVREALEIAAATCARVVIDLDLYDDSE